MIIDFETWKAERVSRRQAGAPQPHVGRPVASNGQCSNCGVALLGFPRWHEEPDGSGWIEVEEACAYGCESATPRSCDGRPQ